MAISNLLIAALTASAILGSIPLAGLAKEEWGNGQVWGAKPGTQANQARPAATGNQPETQLLRQNDSLFPGQSRTQALRLEAETGHINPQEDAVLEPIIKQRQQQAARRPHAVRPGKITRGKPVYKMY